jgi:ribonuclease BN (tRNA processing enzyme)
MKNARWIRVLVAMQRPAVAVVMAFSSLAFAAPPEVDAGTRLVLLGTNGGPVLSANRSEPALMLVTHGKHYLIDAGAGTSGQVVKAGFRPSQIDDIFISHHHIDHNAGLPSLIATIWFERAWRHIDKPPLGIYGPPATEFLVHSALNFLSVSEEIFESGVPELPSAESLFQAHDINEDGPVFADGIISVAAVTNTHFTDVSRGPSGKQNKSYAYRIETPDGSIVYTGDTGPSEAVEKLALNADVLVSEIDVLTLVSKSGLPEESFPGQSPMPPKQAQAQRLHQTTEHLTPEQVGQLASRAHVKTVVLTHFVPSAVADRNPEIFIDGVKRFFTGKVVLGSDLMSIEIPSGSWSSAPASPGGTPHQ